MNEVKSVELNAATTRCKPSSDAVQQRTFIGGALNAISVMVVVAAAAGAVLVAVTLLHSHAESRASLPANQAITVTTQAVKWSNHYTVTRGYVGRLEAGRETAAAFELGGLVVEIKFDEGDAVAKGAVLARLDTAKLAANRRELKAQREELTSQRDLAQLTMKRQDKLQSQGWSPEQRYDEARFGLARLNAAITRIDAVIDALDVDIAKSELKAPFNGKVTARSLDEGAVVASGTTVLRIIESGSPQVRVGISPEAAAELELGGTYQFSAGGHPLSAVLKAKRADLAAGSRTVTALFTLEDKSAQANKSVLIGEVTVLNLERRVELRGIWLPLTALVESRKGLWSVMLAERSERHSSIRREAVEVLHAAGNRVYVRGALKDGDRVVTTGTNRITPGQRVVVARLD